MSEFFRKMQKTEDGKFQERPSIVPDSLEMNHYNEDSSDIEDDPWAEDIKLLEEEKRRETETKKMDLSQIPEIVENGEFEPLIDGIFTVSLDYDNMHDKEIDTIIKTHRTSKLIFPPQSNFKCFSDPRISQNVQEITSYIYPNNSEIEVLEECSEEWEDYIN